jgi:pilus assembly protein CpaB
MKRILAVLAAVVLALLGSIAVLGYANAADRRAVAGQEAVTVYVTSRIVPAGTPLAEAVADGSLQKTVFAAKSVPTGALLEIEPDSSQLVAMSNIAPGEIVLSRRFGTQQAGSTALMVPEGMVAITVELTDPGRVGPFLRPGSTIAVYDTYWVREPVKDLVPGGAALRLGDETPAVNATQLVLPSAEVLAVGDVTLSGRADAPEGSDDVQGKPREVPTALVTVAVTPLDGQRLVHAAQTGFLYAGLLGEGAEGGSAVVEDRTLFTITPEKAT